jgi:hypothetical protein
MVQPFVPFRRSFIFSTWVTSSRQSALALETFVEALLHLKQPLPFFSSQSTAIIGGNEPVAFSFLTLVQKGWFGPFSMTTTPTGGNPSIVEILSAVSSWLFFSCTCFYGSASREL